MWQYLKTEYKKITNGEKEFVFIVALVVLLLTITPIIFACLYSGDRIYTGETFVAAADKMVYLSQIEEVKQGHWLIHNLHTSEPQIGIFSPLWLVLGEIAGLFKAAPLLIFHVARFVLGFVFICLLYLFTSQIFLQLVWRKVAFLTLMFGSGLGVFTVNRPWTPENMTQYFGVDIWFSEGNTFLTLYHSPLFILSQICLLLIFWWVIARLDAAKYGEVIIIGLLGLFLGIIHPYDMAIVLAVTGIWFLASAWQEKHWCWPRLLKLAIIWSIALLSLLYFYLLAYYSPGFDGWLKQNITLSPRLLNYIIGYGFIFIFFIFGALASFRSKNKYRLFLAVWALTSWCLLYAPVPSQRRLGNGLHMPMVILAVWGLIFVADKLKQTRVLKVIIEQYFIRTIIIFLLIFFTATSNLFFIGAEFYNNIRGGYNLSLDEKNAMIWLKNNVKDGEVILSQNVDGTIIPALSGRYVYLGHGHQTNNWLAKKYDVEEWFFKDNLNDRAKSAWLAREKISYIYYSVREKALGDFNPEEKNYLEKVFNSPEASVYRVR